MRQNVLLQAVSLCFVTSIVCSGSVLAEEHPGEKIFNRMKCTTCHGIEAKQRGPSLIKIANAYADAEELLLFFNGKKEAIVEPDRVKTMRPRLRKIMKLSDPEKKDLAKYLMGFKQSP